MATTKPVLPPAVEAALDAKRRSAAAAKHRAEVLEAELRGFEEAARLLSARPGMDVPPAADAGPGDGFAPDERLPPGLVSGDPPRAVSGQWRGILGGMAACLPAGLSLDDLQGIAVRLGTPTPRTTLRSQMSIYRNLGIVERTAHGRYKLTALGAGQVGIPAPSPSTGPDAAPRRAGGSAPADADGHPPGAGQPDGCLR